MTTAPSRTLAQATSVACALSCLLISTPAGAQVGGQFSSGQTATPSTPTNVQNFTAPQKVLTGRISILDSEALKALHQNFKLKAQKAKSSLFVNGESFNDFIKRNNFLANAFLIQLSPPALADARALLTTSTTQLEQARDTLAKYEKLRAAAEVTLNKLEANERAVTNSLKWLQSYKIPVAQRTLLQAQTDLSNAQGKNNPPDQLQNLAEKVEKAQEALDKLFLVQGNYQARLAQLNDAKPSAELDKTVSDDLEDSAVQWIAECRRDRSDSMTDLSRANHPDPDKIPLVNGMVKYLLVLNYNLPAVRPFGLAINYRFARFCGQLMLRRPASSATSNGGTQDDFDDQTFSYDSIPIISSYPQNMTTTADLTNKSTWQLQANPQWAGISGGSITYTNETDIAQTLRLPRIVGMNTSNGEAQWTFYPAKFQQIGFGSQTAYAVILVQDAHPNDLLQMDLALDYEYKAFKIPLGKNREYESICCKLSDALYKPAEIDEFRRMYLRSISLEDQAQIERLLSLKDPATASKASSDKSDDKKDASDTGAAKPPAKAAPAKKTAKKVAAKKV